MTAAKAAEDDPGRSPRDAAGAPFPRILLLLAALLLLPELLLQAADAGLVGSPRWRSLAYQYGGFWAGLLHGWRPNYDAQPLAMFLTYAFLHGGLAHVIGNLLGLISFGRIVAERMGAARLVLLLLVAVLGGAGAFGLLAASPRPMVGASGAVFGLIGACALWQMQDRRAAGQGFLAALLPFLAITAGLVLFNIAMLVLLRGLLAWETHLGGYLGGIAAAALLAPRRRN